LRLPPKIGFDDRPTPDVVEWLRRTKTYFSNRGYSADDVRLVVDSQTEYIDHVVRNVKDRAELCALISATFSSDDSAALSFSNRTLRKSYAALAHCFAGLPELGFARGYRSIAIKGLTNFLAVVVFFTICYVVIGALLAGQSDFGPANSSPLLGLALLGGLLVLLAYVEGSHISIARLQNARIPATYSSGRVVRLHRLVRSTEDASKFFAGRQIMVIIIVFFVSRLTSFPNLTTFPFTSVALPGGVFTPITVIFVQYGIAGAVFVYWFGQMIPQLIATKAPTWVLNDPFGELVTRLGKFIGELGVASPAEYVASFFGNEPDIPQDSRARYLQLSEDNGWSYLAQRKVWRFSETAATITYGHVSTFLVPGMRAFTDYGLLLLRSLNPTPSVRSELFRQNGTIEHSVPTAEEALQTNDIGDYVQFTSSVSPKWGNFEVGDVLCWSVHGGVRLDRVMEDTYQIGHPVQHFLFRCAFPERFGIVAPTVTITRLVDDGMRESREVAELRIEDAGQGMKAFEYAAAYPAVGSRLKFSWAFHDG
jgi:hypothetical protein